MQGKTNRTVLLSLSPSTLIFIVGFHCCYSAFRLNIKLSLVLFPNLTLECFAERVCTHTLQKASKILHDSTYVIFHSALFLVQMSLFFSLDSGSALSCGDGVVTKQGNQVLKRLLEDIHLIWLTPTTEASLNYITDKLHCIYKKKYWTNIH